MSCCARFCLCAALVLAPCGLHSRNANGQEGNAIGVKQALSVFLKANDLDAGVIDLDELEQGLFDLSRVHRVAVATDSVVIAAAAARLPDTGVREQEQMVERALLEHCKVFATIEAVAALAAPRIESTFELRDADVTRWIARDVSTRLLAAKVKEPLATTGVVDRVACALVALRPAQIRMVQGDCRELELAPDSRLDFSVRSCAEGCRLLGKGELEAAYRHLQRAERAAPENAVVVPGLLACHQRSGRMTQFQEVALSALGRSEMTPQLLRHAGRLCESAERLDLAVQLYAEALEQSPNDVGAEAALVRTYVRLTTHDREGATPQTSQTEPHREVKNR